MGAPAARAVNTLENYEPGGLTDFEAYLGYEGIGRTRAERSVTASYLLGVGITDWFSGRYAESAAFSEQFSQGESTRCFGVFATPLDTYHFDLDLILDVGFVDGQELTITPGFEFNVDAQPDLSSFGLFLIGGSEFGGHEASEDIGARHTVRLALTMGTYVTFAEDHQALLSYDTVVMPEQEAGERDMEVGALRLGYNATVHESIELIHEVSLDTPQGEERAGVGVMFGVLTTLL